MQRDINLKRKWKNCAFKIKKKFNYAKKVCEDYEPISNIGVCSALLIVLGTAAYMSVFSSSKEVEIKPVEATPRVIQKSNQMPLLINQQKADQKERSN